MEMNRVLLISAFFGLVTLRIQFHFNFLNNSTFKIIASAAEGSCKEWPKDVRQLSDCCELPLLLSGANRRFCYYNCISKNDTCCEMNCVMDKLDVIKDGAISKRKVRNLLASSVAHNKAWMQIINATITQCQDLEKPVDNVGPPSICNQPRPAINYLECIHNKIMLQCPTYMPIEGCQVVKELIEKCPQLAPPLFVLSA